MPHDWFPPTLPQERPPAVLAVVAGHQLGEAVTRELEQFDCELELSPDTTAALARLHERPFDVCLVGDAAGGEIDRSVRAAWSRVPAATQLVRVLPEDDGLEASVVVHPWTAGRLKQAVVDAANRAALVRENESLRRRLVERLDWFAASEHDSVLEFRETLFHAATSRDDVLLLGEPGALFEPWARLVHDCGPRAEAAFVRLDGRTLTADTFEAEHAPGGRVDAVNGGVVFLDHAEATAEAVRDRVRRRNPHLRIAGSAELATQFVLGVEREFDASPAFEHETARTLVVPPLRDRPRDLGAIAEGLLREIASRFGEATRTLTEDAAATLRTHDWPGNEAELASVLEAAFRTGTHSAIDAETVQHWIGTTQTGDDESAGTTLRDMERALIEATFSRCNGNREQTAKSLGIGVRTLSGKLRDYGYPPRGGPGSNRRARKEAA